MNSGYIKSKAAAGQDLAECTWRNFMRVLLPPGDDANDQNLLQKGRPFMMRLSGRWITSEWPVTREIGKRMLVRYTQGCEVGIRHANEKPSLPIAKIAQRFLILAAELFTTSAFRRGYARARTESPYRISPAAPSAWLQPNSRPDSGAGHRRHHRDLLAR